MQEVWKDIKGYEGLYQISNLGNVKSLKRKSLNFKCEKDKILINCKTSQGYEKVMLCKNKQVKNQMIHRLVAKAFIPNPNNLLEINHIDGDKTNNKVSNLEWCTRSENIKHAYELGLNYGSDKLKGRNGCLSKSSIKIYQLDKNDNRILNVFYGSREAERITNIKASSICACCKNKKYTKRGKEYFYKTAGGYKWCYAKDYNEL